MIALLFLLDTYQGQYDTSSYPSLDYIIEHLRVMVMLQNDLRVCLCSSHYIRLQHCPAIHNTRIDCIPLELLELDRYILTA
jgi:hypothetical protein